MVLSVRTQISAGAAAGAVAPSRSQAKTDQNLNTTDHSKSLQIHLLKVTAALCKDMETKHSKALLFETCLRLACGMGGTREAPAESGRT